MNDLISRSDAINAIKARFGNVVVIEEATKALEGVPEISCDGCIYHDGRIYPACTSCIRWASDNYEPAREHYCGNCIHFDIIDDMYRVGYCWKNNTTKEYGSHCDKWVKEVIK